MEFSHASLLCMLPQRQAVIGVYIMLPSLKSSLKLEWNRQKFYLLFRTTKDEGLLFHSKTDT